MLDTLTERLSRVVKTLRGEARLTDANIQDALREVRLALLEADVALPVVKTFIGDLREKAIGAEVVGSLTPGQALIGVVARELTTLMGGAAQPLDFVLEVQLATLELVNGEIVNRGMPLGFCELTLQRLMPELKFRKMRQ